MKIKDITDYLESFAPTALQESYDNCGLITGNADWEVKGVLLCLDSVEDVIAEAIENDCNLVVAHHPIVFSGIKKLNGKNYVERTLIQAIKNDIAIYAIHTNLDNVATGVNQKICEKLGLQHLQILAPKKQWLSKLVTFVPETDAESLRQAIFDAGGGNIGNYSACSFNSKGTGTFKGNKASNPIIGEREKLESAEELKVEIVFPKFLERNIIAAMKKAHPYEEVAFDIIPLENYWQQTGSGMVGELEKSISTEKFLEIIQKNLKAAVIRHTGLVHQEIKKVAVCGGSGSFLLNDAIRGGADLFLTSDFKYHQFFDAEGKIIIADIGHYESEQFTVEILHDLLSKKFTTFATLFSKISTNPVKYFC